jgi:hypothetical protein
LASPADIQSQAAEDLVEQAQVVDPAPAVVQPVVEEVHTGDSTEDIAVDIVADKAGIQAAVRLVVLRAAAGIAGQIVQVDFPFDNR